LWGPQTTKITELGFDEFCWRMRKVEEEVGLGIRV